MCFVRVSLAALVVLTLGVLAPTASSASPDVTESRRTVSLSAVYAKTAHTTTNVVRTVRGLNGLGKSRCLRRMAAKQANAMAERGEMFHQNLGPVLRRCGLSTTGENVAYGFDDGKSVVSAWMASPGHRANILKNDYRQMGIAARQSDEGQWFVAQVFGRKA